jgi:hypothetical protein
MACDAFGEKETIKWRHAWKWRTQRGDLRTFLGDFVMASERLRRRTTRKL